MRRAWAATDHWLGRKPIVSGKNVGVSTRLGQLVAGRDEWHHPSNEAEAAETARIVAEHLRTTGRDWLESMTDPDLAIGSLPWSDGPLPIVEVVGALLVERPGDPRRPAVRQRIEYWQVRLRKWRSERRDTTLVDEYNEDALLAWLIERLADEG